MVTDPNVPPSQHAMRKVPIEYQDKVEKELDQMERTRNHHQSDRTNRVSQLHNLSCETKWRSAYLSGSKGPKQGNHQRTLQSYPQLWKKSPTS